MFPAGPAVGAAAADLFCAVPASIVLRNGVSDKASGIYPCWIALRIFLQVLAGFWNFGYTEYNIQPPRELCPADAEGAEKQKMAKERTEQPENLLKKARRNTEWIWRERKNS